jgi:hypothetical protein
MEKLGNRHGTDGLMLPYGLSKVNEALDVLEQAIRDREEPFDEQWQGEYKRLRRALAMLDDHAKGGGACDDLLADILADYIRYTIDHLKVLTGEIDQWYAEGAKDRDKSSSV